MANGDKNKIQFDLGFDREEYTSPSEISDSQDSTKNILNFDFSRPIDRISVGSIDLEPDEISWYPGKGLIEGFEQGYKGLVAGYKYLPTILNPDSKYDQMKALKGYEDLMKSAPPPADDDEKLLGAGQFIGKLIPSALPILGGIGATYVTKNPAIGKAIGIGGFAGLSASSFGQGMYEYDTYKISKGEDPYENPSERLAIGVTYAGAEFIGEVIPLAKFLPKSVKNVLGRNIAGKVMKRSFFPEMDDEFIKYANKNFQKFAKSSSGSSVKKGIKKLFTYQGGKLAGLEGVGEVITEIGQKWGDWYITDNEEAFKNAGKDFRNAFLGGFLMGGGLGVASYSAQNSMIRERRAKQENLFFVEHEGKFKEILEKKGTDTNAEYVLMDAYGETSNAKASELSGSVYNISNEQFDAILKSKQHDVELENEAFIFDTNLRLEQEKQTLIDVGEFVKRTQKKEAQDNPVINVASIKGEDVVITGRGSDQKTIFGFKLDEFQEKEGTATIQVYNVEDIDNGEVDIVDVGEVSQRIEESKLETVDKVNNSSRPVVGQKFDIDGVSYKVVGTSPQEVNLQNEDGEVSTLGMEQYTALNKAKESTTSKDGTISLDQIQFNEDGTIISEIIDAETEVKQEKFEVGNKVFKVKSLDEKTGARELSETYKTEKTAQKYADLLNEQYGNQTFEIENRLDPNDPLAKNDYYIVAKPKINDKQINKIKAKAKEVQKKEKIFSKGADDVMKAIETNQGKEQAEIFKTEYDRLVDETIQARQEKGTETVKPTKKTVKKVKTKPSETKSKAKKPIKPKTETKAKKKTPPKAKVVIKKASPQMKIKFSKTFFDSLPNLDEKADKGMYYTRVVNPFNKNEVKKVENIIKRITGSWKTAPKIAVYQSLNDYRAENGQANVDEYTNAFWDHNTNQIVFFADMMVDEKTGVPSAGRVQELLYHETVGHQGLRGILPTKELNSTLDKVYDKIRFRSLNDFNNSKNKELQKQVFYYHFHSLDSSLQFDPTKNYLNEVKPNGYSLTVKDTRDIAEEYIAHESEKGENRATINKLSSLFKSGIQKLTGKKVDLLDKQVNEIIQSSKQYMKVGDVYVNKNVIKQASQNNYNQVGGQDTKTASKSRILDDIKTDRNNRRRQLEDQVDRINESVEILEKNYQKGKTVNTSKGKDVVSNKLIENLLGKNNKADEQYLKLANILKDYNQVRGTYSDNITDINEAKQVFEEAKSDIKSNLLFIYNNINPDIRNISKLWYDSANSTIAKKLTEEYGVTRDQASGVIAVMSPQKDWFRNVALADRVLKIVVGNKGYAFDQNMAKYLINAVDQKGNKIFLKNLKPTERKRKINGFVGKKITDLKGDDVGLFIRAFDNEYLPDKSYYNYSPTGDVIGKVKTKAGLNSKIAWGSTGEIGKAVSIIQNGSKENISNELGDQHKVRSFYNNISDPKDSNSVTIDTHAIASAYLLPLAGSDQITLLGLGGSPASLVTGVKGTYGLIADAYREVANDLKILPRELQSIVWEGVRGFYSDTFKRNKNNKLQVNRIWEDYKLGNIKDKKEVFAKLKEIGGDFNNPVWLENVLNGDNSQVEQKTKDQNIANLDVEVLEGQENVEAEKVFKQSRNFVNSQEFNKFFEGSLVVNEDGTPKVMFHGTPTSENINDIWFSDKFIGKGNDELGSGYYFTTKPVQASIYSESHNFQKSKSLPQKIKEKLGEMKFTPGIIPVYLSVKNPMPSEFATTTDQIKNLILASPLVQSKDEVVNPLSNWHADFNDLIKTKAGLENMVDEVAESYASVRYNETGRDISLTKRDMMVIMNDFFDGGEFAPQFLKAINDVYGYDGYIESNSPDSVVNDADTSVVVAFFPEQIQSALQTDININQTPIKKSINMNFEYNENKRNNLISDILNSMDILPSDQKLSYGEWIKHFVQYTDLDITKAKWLGITKRMKNKKLSPKEVWDIVAETQINIIDMNPKSDSKMLILSRQWNGNKNPSEVKEAFTDTTLDHYVRVEKVGKTLIVFGAKDISKKIDPVLVHKKLIKYATMNDIDVLVSPDIKSLNQIKTTFDYKTPISSKKFEHEGKTVTYYDMMITPVLKNLALSEAKMMQSRSLGVNRKTLKNARFLFQDSLIYLKDLQDKIESKGTKIKDYNNAYVLENLSKGKILNANEIFEAKYGVRLKDTVSNIINNNNVTTQEVNDYVYAKHALERNVINPSGMTNEEATAIMKDFEKKVSKKDIDNLVNIVKDVNRFIIQLSFDSGLITKEKFNMFYPRKGKSKTAMFDFYVPLRGFEEADSDPTIFVDINKKMKGRSSKAESPLAYLLGMARTTIERAEKNKYKKALYNLVLENPDSNSYQIKNIYYKNLDDKIVEDTEKGTSNKLKLSQADLKAQKELQNYQNQNQDWREREVIVMVNGEKKIIEFFGDDNRKVAQGINNFVPDNSIGGKIISASNFVSDPFGTKYNLGTVTGIMRSFFTQYSPEFIPVNFIRDMSAGMLNITTDYGVGTSIDVAKETGKSIKALREYFFNNRKLPEGKEGEYLAQFIENGTRTGYSQPRTIDELKKEFKNLDKTLDANNDDVRNRFTVIKDKSAEFGNKIKDLLDNTNLTLENAVRYSAFKTLLKKGESLDTASKYAKDLTVNFNKKGLLTNGIAPVYLFFNAGVQGVERLTRPLFNEKTKKNALTTFGVLATAGFSLQMLARVLVGEDDDGKYFYDKLPEYIRNKNMVIPNPLYLAGITDETKFLLIPLPYGFSSIYSASDPFVRLGLGYQSAGSATLSLLDALAESFSPLGSVNFENRSVGEATASYLAPTALKPLVDVSQNKNFMGSPIYPSENPFARTQKPGYRDHFNNVNGIAKWFAKGVNTVTGGDALTPGYVSPNPEVIEYLVSQYLGGVGATVNRSFKMVQNLIEGKPIIDDINDVPLVRRFATQSQKFDDYGVYYDMLNAINEAKETKRNGQKLVDEGYYTRAEYREKLKEKQSDAFGYTIDELVRLGDTKLFGRNRRGIYYTIQKLKEERDKAFNEEKYELAQKKEKDILKQMKKFNKFVTKDKYSPVPFGNMLEDLLGE